MVQAVYLMPKPKIFSEQNIPQPYVGGILGTNILCIIFHLINSPPNAGEATRGYLHGSLLLDFVGQLGPTSKIRLFLLDVIILLLQLIALAANSEKKELDNKKASDEAYPNTESNNQDHDAEERGEVRGTSVGPEAIEVQELSDSAATIMQESEESRQTHTFTISDNIASGQAIIGEFFLVDSVRHQYSVYQKSRNQQQPANNEEANSDFASIIGSRLRQAEQLSRRNTG
jgi:hypothetical protein